MLTREDINPEWDDPSKIDSKYPPDWEARKKVVKRRDNETCQHCGVLSGSNVDGDAPTLHIHHVTYLSEGGSHSLENLITLCASCHQEEHDHDFGEEWVEDSGTEYPDVPTAQEPHPVRAAVERVGSGIVTLIPAITAVLPTLLVQQAVGGPIEALAAVFGATLLLSIWLPGIVILASTLLGLLTFGILFLTDIAIVSLLGGVFLTLAWGPALILVVDRVAGLRTVRL